MRYIGTYTAAAVAGRCTFAETRARTTVVVCAKGSYNILLLLFSN